MRSSRLTVAMFAGGVATFGELYAIQAVLPALADSWSLSESTAALAISVATGALAVAVLPWAAVADRVGRARTMVISVSVAAVCGLLLPAAPGLAVLLVLRALSGAALAAVPALAMAHLVELAPAGRAVAAGGIYIAGTTLGGLSGRLLTGTVAGVIGGADGWRWGLLATAVFVAALTVVFAVLLPAGRPGPSGQSDQSRQSRRPAPRAGRIRRALTGGTIWAVYAQGFLLMGGFVTLYNLLPFRLLAAPYRVPASLVSLMFLTYLVGTAGSSAVGQMTGRFGRRAVMTAGAAGMAAGTALTLAGPLPLVVTGLVVATFGFFVAHAIAAGWSGVLVPSARSQATALYSLGYYLGSAALGYAGAVIFTASGWTGAALVVTGWAALAAIIGLTVVPGARATSAEPHRGVRR